MKRTTLRSTLGLAVIALVALAGATFAQDTMVIENNKVGIGTTTPTKTLHVSGSNGQTQLLIEELSGTEQARTVLNLINNGPGYLRMQDTSPDGGGGWTFQPEGPSLRLNKAGTGAPEVVIRGRNDPDGTPTFTVNGSIQATNVTFSSSRALKTEITSVDPATVLAKVVALPIAEWRFHTGGPRHIGPMAEDFADAFALGGKESSISMIDTSGVALAAVQALNAKLDEKTRAIEELSAQNETLIERLSLLESRLAALSQN